MKKGTRNKIIFALVVITLLLSITLVMALNTENIQKGYDPVGRKVTFYDGVTEVATAKLNTPLVYQVQVGYNKVAEFTLTSKEDYVSFLDSIEYYNVKDNLKQVQKPVDIKYLNMTNLSIDYKVCTYDKDNNSICEDKVRYETIKEWLPWDKSIQKDKEVTIGLFTDVGFDEEIEWLPTFLNNKVQEWAIYTSGAVVTTNGSYTIVTYINNGTFNTSTSITNAEVLIIGAGGAGGGSTDNLGGGGGAGGVVNNSALNITAGNYHIKVGTGGVGNGGVGNNGSNSSAFGLVGFGGAGGGKTSIPGANGGSGGGSKGSVSGGSALQINFSNGSAFGNNGGAGGATEGAGAGGSALHTGQSGQSQIGGNSTWGGVPSAFNSSINGSLTYYACGGAGGGTNAGYSGRGENPACANAGGYWLTPISSSGANATAYGSGGGGSGYNGTSGTFSGGNGKGGIVIIKYLTTQNSTGTINISHLNSNNTIFYSTIILNDYVNASPGVSIVNVSLVINGTINQTNSTGVNNANYTFTLTTGDGIYFYDVIAYDNYSTMYSSLNGTYAFNKSTLPLQKPVWIVNLPNFTMNYNEAGFLLSNITDYFTTGYSNESNITYVNFSFYDNDSLQWVNLSGLLNPITPLTKFLDGKTTSYLSFFTSSIGVSFYERPLWISAYSGDINKSTEFTYWACNEAGCTEGNETFYIHINDTIVFTQGDSFITKTSDRLASIFPDSERLSPIQRIGLVTAVLIAINLLIFFGFSAYFEGIALVAVTLLSNLLAVIYFTAIGYIPLGLIYLIVLIIAGVTYFKLKNNG